MLLTLCAQEKHQGIVLKSAADSVAWPSAEPHADSRDLAAGSDPGHTEGRKVASCGHYTEKGAVFLSLVTANLQSRSWK